MKNTAVFCVCLSTPTTYFSFARCCWLECLCWLDYQSFFLASALVGAERDCCGRYGRWEGPISRRNRVHFPKPRVSFWRTVASAGCTLPVFRHSKVKMSIDQAWLSFTLKYIEHPVIVSQNQQGALCCVFSPLYI